MDHALATDDASREPRPAAPGSRGEQAREEPGDVTGEHDDRTGHAGSTRPRRRNPASGPLPGNAAAKRGAGVTAHRRGPGGPVDAGLQSGEMAYRSCHLVLRDLSHEIGSASFRERGWQ